MIISLMHRWDLMLQYWSSSIFDWIVQNAVGFIFGFITLIAYMDQWKTNKELKQILDIVSDLNFRLETEPINFLIKELHTKDASIQKVVIRILGDKRAATAVGPLIGKLYSKDVTVQEYAEEALIKIGEHAIESLTQELQSNDNQIVRERVFRILEKIGSASAASLIRLIGDTNPIVKANAAKALGVIKDPDAINPLIRLLTDGDSTVRANAVMALGSVGDPRSIEPLISALGDQDDTVSKIALKAFKKFGALSVDPLIRALDNKNPDIEANAAKVLGNLRCSDAVEPLISHLNSEHPALRASAAKALGVIKDPDAINPLIRLLTDDDSTVRANAVMALRSIGDPRSIEPLISALGDQDDTVSKIALKALKKFGALSVNPLIRALGNKDSDLKANVAEALGTLGSKTAIIPLLEHLKDGDDSTVRVKIIIAIGEIGPVGGSEGNEVDNAVIDRLNPLACSDRDPTVRREAQETLKKFGLDIRAYSFH